MDPSNGQTAGQNGDVALLVDWENLKYSLAQRDRRPNVTALRLAAEQFGRIVYARAYADWQEPVHGGDAASLYMAGLEPVYVLTKRYFDGGDVRIKNSVDVKLAADCVEASHTYPNIGTYIIVSGDHGFLHLVNTLRPHGKRVVVVGVSWTTAAQLVEQADQVLYYDLDIDVERPAAAAATAEPAPPATAKKITPAMAQTAQTAIDHIKTQEPAAEIDPRKMAETLDLVLTVAREYRQDKRELSVSLLGQELQKRMAPSDFQRLARGRARTVAQALAQHGSIKLISRDFVDWIYLADEPDELIAANTPLPPAQPRYSYEGLVFSDLTRDQQDKVVLTINDERLRPGVDWLTFNKVMSLLSPVIGRDDYSVRNLVNNMLDIGVLRFDGERMGRDPNTGAPYQYRTISLDIQNVEVQRALRLG